MAIHIPIKLEGFDEFQRELKNMAKRAKELSETKTVPFDELFTASFMEKCSNFTSFDELLEAGGFEVKNQEDFIDIPDDVFDKHVADHTHFNTWQDMLDTAFQEYVTRRLGF